MQLVGMLAQITIALGIFNVWVLRYNKSTSYQGASARTCEKSSPRMDFRSGSCA